jgi:hypothetical protein
MRYIAFALATAACLTVGQMATAQELNIGIGSGDHRERSGVEIRGDRDRDVRGNVEIRGGERSFNRERIVVRRAHDCRMTTVRTRRPNGNIVIRQIRRCG